LIIAFFAAALLVSCKDYYNICDQNRTSTANGNFYSIVGGIEMPIAPTGLVVTALNGPVTSSNVGATPTFSLYLTPNVDSASFTIKTSNKPLDTIKLKYNTQMFMLSEDCGQISKFNILSITHTSNTIDSIKITNPFAEQLLGNNFRIYQ
jgi:hypothetical protein